MTKQQIKETLIMTVILCVIYLCMIMLMDGCLTLLDEIAY